MKILRVGSDFHGLLVNVQLLRQKIFWEMTGVWISNPDLIKREIIVKYGFMTHTEFNELLQRIYANPYQLVESASPYPGALDALHYHALAGDEVRVITGSDEPAFQAALHWFEHYGITSTRFPHIGVYGSGRRGDKTLLTQGLDIHMEDEVAPLVQIRRNRHRYNADTAVKQLWLMERRHNVQSKLPNGIKRIINYKHYIAEVDRYRHAT